MSEVTGSTNVDNSKEDKYLKDIKSGVPSVNGVLEHLAQDQTKGIEIAIDPRMSGRATGDTIRDFGGVSIPVHSVPREQYDQIKAALKAKQAAQEKARAVVQEGSKDQIQEK